MTYTALTRMAFGHVDAQVVYAAVRLGVADALAAGPVPVEKLADTLDCDPDGLARLVRALVVLGLADEAVPGQVALTGLGRPLCADHPESLRSAVLLTGHPATWRAWGALTDAVRAGGSAFRHAHGRPLFDHLPADPDLAAAFHTAMGDGTGQVTEAIVRAYDFGAARTVVDLGGGDGTLLAAVLTGAPHTCGVLLDREDGAVRASETLRRAVPPERWSVRAGDFFTSVPAGDLLLLKGVLHDFGDRRCVDLLRTCRRSIAPDGRLLVLEAVLPPRPGPDYAAVVMSDLAMLAWTGGRERTVAGFRGLLAAAGFTLSGVGPPLAGTPTRILIATPS